jgi:hypothetical protein
MFGFMNVSLRTERRRPIAIWRMACVVVEKKLEK